MENGTLVLYHDSCNDGFCAAWLWSRHGQSLGKDAEYRAVLENSAPVHSTRFRMTGGNGGNLRALVVIINRWQKVKSIICRKSNKTGVS